MRGFRPKIFLFSFLIFLYPAIAFNIFPINDLESDILPDGVTFNSVTGKFDWTPRYNQVGVYNFRFKVNDGHGGYDSEDITVNVIK